MVYKLGFFCSNFVILLGEISILKCFFSRPSPKAGRELHIDRMDDEGGRQGPLVKNQPEPVTGP